MRRTIVAMILAGLAGPAIAQSAATPTPATRSPNPGAAATDAIVSPAKPATISPDGGGSVPPAAPETLTGAELRELLDAVRATAKATREAVDYGRVVPDILTQILAKLDKIEDKLDRIDANGKPAPRRR